MPEQTTAPADPAAQIREIAAALVKWANTPIVWKSSHVDTLFEGFAARLTAIAAQGEEERREVRIGTRRCGECRGLLIWDTRWQGWSCHFCHKAFEDNLSDLGIDAVADAVRLIEQNTAADAAQEAAVQRLREYERVFAEVRRLVETVDAPDTFYGSHGNAFAEGYAACERDHALTPPRAAGDQALPPAPQREDA